MWGALFKLLGADALVSIAKTGALLYLGGVTIWTVQANASGPNSILVKAYSMFVGGCGACTMVGNMFVISTYLGAEIYRRLATDFFQLGGLIFGLWMLLQGFKIINPFASGQMGPGVLGEMLKRGLYMLLIVTFLNGPSVTSGTGGGADPFYDWVMSPIRDLGLAASGTLMDVAETGFANGGSLATGAPAPGTPLASGRTCGSFSVMVAPSTNGFTSPSAGGGGTLTNDPGVQKFLCVVEKMQNTIGVGVVLGVKMMSIDLTSGVLLKLGMDPTSLGTMLLQALSGLILLLSYVFLMTRLVFALVDVLWKWFIAWIIGPLCMLAFATPATSGYGIKVVKLIAQASIMFLFLSGAMAVVGVMLSYLPIMLSEEGVQLRTLSDVYQSFQAEANKSVVLTVFDARYIYLIFVAWVGQALIARASPMSEALIDWRDGSEVGAELYSRTRGSASAVTGGVGGAAAGAAGKALGSAGGGVAKILSKFKGS